MDEMESDGEQSRKSDDADCESRMIAVATALSLERPMTGVSHGHYDDDDAQRNLLKEHLNAVFNGSDQLRVIDSRTVPTSGLNNDCAMFAFGYTCTANGVQLNNGRVPSRDQIATHIIRNQGSYRRQFNTAEFSTTMGVPGALEQRMEAFARGGTQFEEITIKAMADLSGVSIIIVQILGNDQTTYVTNYEAEKNNGQCVTITHWYLEGIIDHHYQATRPNQRTGMRMAAGIDDLVQPTLGVTVGTKRASGGTMNSRPCAEHDGNGGSTSSNVTGDPRDTSAKRTAFGATTMGAIGMQSARNDNEQGGKSTSSAGPSPDSDTHAATGEGQHGSVYCQPQVDVRRIPDTSSEPQRGSKSSAMLPKTIAALHAAGRLREQNGGVLPHGALREIGQTYDVAPNSIAKYIKEQIAGQRELTGFRPGTMQPSESLQQERIDALSDTPWMQHSYASTPTRDRRSRPKSSGPFDGLSTRSDDETSARATPKSRTQSHANGGSGRTDTPRAAADHGSGGRGEVPTVIAGKPMSPRCTPSGTPASRAALLMAEVAAYVKYDPRAADVPVHTSTSMSAGMGSSLVSMDTCAAGNAETSCDSTDEHMETHDDPVILVEADAQGLGQSEGAPPVRMHLAAATDTIPTQPLAPRSVDGSISTSLRQPSRQHRRRGDRGSTRGGRGGDARGCGRGRGGGDLLVRYEGPGSHDVDDGDEEVSDMSCSDDGTDPRVGSYTPDMSGYWEPSIDDDTESLRQQGTYFRDNGSDDEGRDVPPPYRVPLPTTRSAMEQCWDGDGLDVMANDHAYTADLNVIRELSLTAMHVSDLITLELLPHNNSKMPPEIVAAFVRDIYTPLLEQLDSSLNDLHIARVGAVPALTQKVEALYVNVIVAQALMFSKPPPDMSIRKHGQETIATLRKAPDEWGTMGDILDRAARHARKQSVHAYHDQLTSEAAQQIRRIATTIRNVERLIREGAVSKAMSTLTRTTIPMAADSSDVKEFIQSQTVEPIRHDMTRSEMYAAYKANPGMFDDEEEAEERHLRPPSSITEMDDDAFRIVLERLPSKRQPSGDRITAEDLRACISRGRQGIWKHQGDRLVHTLNNILAKLYSKPMLNMPTAIIRMLGSATAVVVRKPGKKPRLISMECVLAKAGLAPMSKLVNAVTRRVTHNIQMGVSVPGGLEQTVNLIAISSELRNRLVYIAIDKRGAYPNISKDMVMLEVLKHLPPAAAEVMYQALNVDRTLSQRAGLTGLNAYQSAEGLAIGGKLSGALFSLVQHSITKQYASKLSPGDGEYVVCYIDDESIRVHPEMGVAVLTYLTSDRAKDAGIFVQMDKLSMLVDDSFTREEAHDIAQRFEGLGMKPELIKLHPALAPEGDAMRATEMDLDYGVVALGVPIGSNAFIQAHVNAYCDELAGVYEAIAQVKDAQSQNELLRQCMNGKPMHLYRQLPPEFTMQIAGAQVRGQEVVMTSMTRTDAPLTALSMQMAQTPAMKGGIGLNNPRDIIDIAYIAATAESLTFCMEKSPTIAQLVQDLIDHEVENPYDEPPILVGDECAIDKIPQPASRDEYRGRLNAWQAAIRRQHQLNPHLTIESLVHGEYSKGETGLQRVLMQVVKDARHQATKRDVYATQDAHKIAMFTSAQGFLAGAFLSAIPTSAAMTLESSVFANSVRTRMFVDIPGHPHDQRKCPLCDANVGGRAMRDGSHYEACPAMPDISTGSHNGLRDNYATLLRLGTSSSVTVEPPRTDMATRKRPDIITTDMFGRKMAHDIKITNPVHMHMSVHDATTPRVAAERGARRKILYYQKYCADNHMTMMPCVVESSGCPCDAFDGHLRKVIAEAVEKFDGMPASMLSLYWYRRLSVCIQRGVSGETVTRAREGLRRLHNNNRQQHEEAHSGEQVPAGGRNDQGADESQDADVIRLAASR